MALKNSLVALAAFVLLPLVGQAQSGESLWRVQSDVKAQAVEPYQKQENPFPQREAPPVNIEPVQPQQQDPSIVQEMLREQERARQAAYLLEKLRKIIVNESLLVPSLRGLQVDGRLKGRKGAQVLIKNQWLGEGDVLVVPATGAEEAFGLLEEISAVDEKLAEIVADDLSERLNKNNKITLKITSITPQEVVLKENNGEAHVITMPFEH